MRRTEGVESLFLAANSLLPSASDEDADGKMVLWSHFLISLLLSGLGAAQHTVDHSFSVV